MILSETWMDERGWERIRRKMPKGYRWVVQWAGKKSKKGRASGGNILGVSEGIKVERKGKQKIKEWCRQKYG